MGAAASPLITTLVSPLTGVAVEWPVVGYDDPTLHMCLFVEAVLVMAFIFTCAMIYHWSREDTTSDERLHGARDAKFQVRQSMALGETQQDDCGS